MKTKAVMLLFLSLTGSIILKAQKVGDTPNLKKVQQVISVDRVKADKSSGSYSKSMNKWALTKNEVLIILKNAIPISKFEKLEGFDAMPCYIAGRVLLANQVYKYRVEGGAVIVISNVNDTAKYAYFGCKAKKCAKYFISPYTNPSKL